VPTRRSLARDLFERSINLDPTNARAWSGLSSVYASQAVTDEIPFEEGYDRATAAALRAIALDSMESSAWANLAYMRALRTRSLAVGMRLLRRAQALEPSNPELYLIEQNMLTSAHEYERARDAGRVTRQLDPLAANYVDHEALAELCLGRADAALTLYSTELGVNPSNGQARTGVTRSLARLGRFDEAIASWREQARAAGDTLLERGLAAARGREGYWNVRHMDGRRRLARLRRLKTRISPLRVVQASFASGDTASIRGALEEAMATFTPGLLRLACMPDVDEFRGTPTLDGALARIGTLETRK
jgi:tetratricopeptide (TPR) repeat protein